MRKNRFYPAVIQQQLPAEVSKTLSRHIDYVTHIETACLATIRAQGDLARYAHKTLSETLDHTLKDGRSNELTERLVQDCLESVLAILDDTGERLLGELERISSDSLPRLGSGRN